MTTSEIDVMRGQFTSGLWPRFIRSIQIDGLRGWTGQEVEFRFPIVALAGENGTGKSTILKAAASIYEPDAPGQLIRSSDVFINTHWDDITDVHITYRIQRGGNVTEYTITKPTERWRYPDPRPKNATLFSEISRTLPVEVTIGYSKVAKETTSEISSVDLDPDYKKRLCYIMSREYSSARIASPDVDTNKPVGVLGRTFGEYSQFHQGSGEATCLELMRRVASAPDNCLIVIDEIEASLHPRAQRRFVEALIWVCRRKRAQVILSTHSPYVLEELPPEARVLLLPSGQGTTVIYGASPEFALSRLDDELHAELAVFVEDRESGIMLREILATTPVGQGVLQRLDIRPIGPANVVRTVGELGAANKFPYRSLGILDGDQDAVAGLLMLPGKSAPERCVFEDLKAKGWKTLPERFGVPAGDLLTILDDAVRLPDHHEWSKYVGDRVRMSRCRCLRAWRGRGPRHASTRRSLRHS